MTPEPRLRATRAARAAQIDAYIAELRRTAGRTRPAPVPAPKPVWLDQSREALPDARLASLDAAESRVAGCDEDPGGRAAASGSAP